MTLPVRVTVPERDCPVDRAKAASTVFWDWEGAFVVSGSVGFWVVAGGSVGFCVAGGSVGFWVASGSVGVWVVSGSVTSSVVGVSVDPSVGSGAVVCGGRVVSAERPASGAVGAGVT